jgi:hypothetical protein
MRGAQQGDVLQPGQSLDGFPLNGRVHVEQTVEGIHETVLQFEGITGEQDAIVDQKGHGARGMARGSEGLDFDGASSNHVAVIQQGVRPVYFRAVIDSQ